MHLSQAEIRAYQDQEMLGPARQRVEAHLAACARCQAAAEQVHTRAQHTADRLSRLSASPSSHPSDPLTARRRFAARLNQTQKEKTPMSKNLFNRLPRPAWIIITIVLILGMALAFPSVRATAVSFLGLFRVEQIQVVQVDTARLPGGLDSSANLEKIFSNDVKIEGGGKAQEASSAAEAGTLAGMAVRQAANLDLKPAFYFQPGGKMTFTVDLELVKAVLKDIQREDIQLPQELDNAVVELDAPASVVILYGDCPRAEPAAAAPGEDPDNPSTWEPKDCISLAQMPSPTISAPPGLDLAQIGEAYLQVLGLSREDAASFARNVDWTTTFVIPISRYSSDYREVTVDGVQGVLLENYGYTNLIWIKDGIVYALSGPRPASEMLAIANALK
jgi:hypothetical protein